MLKIHLFIIVLLLSPIQHFLKAQNHTEPLDKTTINLVYNHYIQDGDNSAITGGKGTEELTVYGPSLGLQKQWGNNTVKVNMGADIISSVSTDNIDFVMSSASILDARSYLNTQYQYTFDKQGLTLIGGVGVSIESDYFSIGSKLGFIKENTKNLSQFSAELQMYNDDLRWGRLSVGTWKPQKLIYPEELRDKEWYSRYRRHSYTLKLGYNKAVNKRSVVGVFPALTYQEGLLSTPFHRIFFDDDTKAVEKLPKHRYKASIGLRWHHFAGGRYIVKSTVNPYIDSWGVLGVSLENETAIKLNPVWTLLPNARIYTQKGSRYFAGYKQHSSADKYYTSDYDLSAYQTYSIGLGVKYIPHHKLYKSISMSTILVRYNYYHRTDGLRGHILTVGFIMGTD